MMMNKQTNGHRNRKSLHTLAMLFDGWEMIGEGLKSQHTERADVLRNKDNSTKAISN